MKHKLHLVKRGAWLKRIESAWERRNIIWLTGVRRVGKTCLCQSLPNIEYFDCELPRTRQMMQDPESFLRNLNGKRVVLDEIHRLPNPAELLKIAADYHADTFFIATGSSTLGASSKFRDTLTGRKVEIWLTPATIADCNDFQISDLKQRLLHGGLPPFLLANQLPEADFQEWMDAYWAKDIQELFRVGSRFSFLRFFELLLAQSGGIFEATKFAAPCEVSRPTINNYLQVLEATFVMHRVRPFSSRKKREIVSAPKVYAFDTGFICYFRGWDQLRPEDLGDLWEHYVLNELYAHLQTRNICYWRDKQGHEIDFILASRGKAKVAIECKWSVGEFDAKSFLSFRKIYPDFNFVVVANDVDRPFFRKYGALTVQCLNLTHLIARIESPAKFSR